MLHVEMIYNLLLAFLWLSLIIMFILILCYWMKHRVPANDEAFTFFRSPDDCPTLLDTIKDPVTHEVLSRRVKTLVNKDGSFLGFKQKDKIYDHNSHYCYIAPDDDETLAYRTKIPCEKSHPLYNFPMIDSVNEGVITIGGETKRSSRQIPRRKDICVMEINKEFVNPEDVNQFNDIIKRHEDTYILRSLNDYRKTLTDKQQSINELKDANEALLQNLKAVRNQYNRSVTQRIKSLRQNIFTQAENDALKYKVVILGIDQYIKYDGTTHIPRMALNLLDGGMEIYDDVSLRAKNLSSKSMAIPEDFIISHIYLPPRTSIKLIKKDRTFVTFRHSTKYYPKTDAIDTKNTVMIEALVS